MNVLHHYDDELLGASCFRFEIKCLQMLSSFFFYLTQPPFGCLKRRPSGHNIVSVDDMSLSWAVHMQNVLHSCSSCIASREYGLSYLSLRTCIGLWTAFLCLVLVATDASSLVCYITRFTEEAFASLICIIFIYEALEKLIHLGETYPINMHNNLDKLTQYS